MKTKHPTEPGSPGFLTELIIGVREAVSDRRYRIPWKVTFQGKTDYEFRSKRLEFRWGKMPWVVCGNDHYWNYASEEDFQREFNGEWGILHWYGCDPVDAETLRIFREEHYPSAVTGYYDHLTHSWIECEPTDQELSLKSYEASK